MPCQNLDPEDLLRALHASTDELCRAVDAGDLAGGGEARTRCGRSRALPANLVSGSPEALGKSPVSRRGGRAGLGRPARNGASAAQRNRARAPASGEVRAGPKYVFPPKARFESLTSQPPSPSFCGVHAGGATSTIVFGKRLPHSRDGGLHLRLSQITQNRAAIQAGNFTPVDAHFAGRDDADLHLRAVDFQYPHLDLIPHHERFSLLPAKNEHHTSVTVEYGLSIWMICLAVQFAGLITMGARRLAEGFCVPSPRFSTAMQRTFNPGMTSAGSSSMRRSSSVRRSW